MTVSEFAIAMYGADVVKDEVKVITSDGNILYSDRMEFLRYADEKQFGDLWFAGATIQTVHMLRDRGDYFTVITI